MVDSTVNKIASLYPAFLPINFTVCSGEEVAAQVPGKIMKSTVICSKGSSHRAVKTMALGAAKGGN